MGRDDCERLRRQPDGAPGPGGAEKAARAGGGHDGGGIRGGSEGDDRARVSGAGRVPAAGRAAGVNRPPSCLTMCYDVFMPRETMTVRIEPETRQELDALAAAL